MTTPIPLCRTVGPVRLQDRARAAVAPVGLKSGSARRGLRIPSVLLKAGFMLEVAVLVLFPALMAYAAASDLLTMTISNRVSMVLVIGFAGLALACGMPPATLFATHLACGAAVLVLTFTLFAFGWIGGGDAKLAAATAVWLGWTHLFDYGLQASLLGAVLTLGIVMWRKHALPAMLADRRWITRLHAAGSGVPYGIALAVAGLAIYPDTAVWTAVSGL